VVIVISSFHDMLAQRFANLAEKVACERSSPRPIDSVLHQQLAEIEDHREDLLVPVACTR